MLVIGLTGGIGSGKSTVARFFAELGVPIIDTDVIARDLVKPGSDTLKKIVEKFGEKVLKTDGSLDRTELRGEIFQDDAKRLWLEELLHPLIRGEALRQVSTLSAPYCIIVIPLLTEPAPNPFIDRVLVVDIDERIQLERACARDKGDEEQMKKIIAAQITREQRLAIANDVIHNDGDPESLRVQVEELDKKYTKKRI